MPDSNLFPTLFTAAEAYRSLSYSVIPLWGAADPARPKVAGIEWSPYQRRRPTPSEIRQWFYNSGVFGGIAIVTGGISRLAVLDFDAEKSFREFSIQHPDLSEHHVVQTRRGYHIYFHLPPHLHLPSRKGEGVDLLSEGRYVVARPTTIDGHTYKLIRGGQPRMLSQHDIERISRLFESPKSIAIPGISAPSLNNPPHKPVEGRQSPRKAAHELQQNYRQGVGQGGGRNETLFRVSLKARDEGWTLDEALLALADLHVWQPAPIHHRQETPAQRYVEARKTIQSAYSRSPRKENQPKQAETHQLPNNVREHLVRVGETRTMRLLDGLRLRGIKPGDAFTTGGALDRLNGVVGRDSVYAALKFVTYTGEPLFRRGGASPLNPPSPADAASDTKTGTNKCFIGRGEKSGKSPNHRPAAVYIMPSDAELCARLGLELEPVHSDPLTLEDLSSAKAARMALHRELIRRRPGNYTRGWLARRLGVTRETIDTYTRETEGIRVRHCFWEQPIFWSNLNMLPDEIEVAGAFLQDESGKRYPPQRDIARRLLRGGKKIVYRRQDANYYWFEDADTNRDRNLLLRQAEEQARLRVAHPKIPPVYVPYIETAASGQSDVQKPVYIWTRTATPEAVKSYDAPPPIKIASDPPRGQRHYKKPLPDGDAEQMAQKLCAQMREKSTDAKGYISQAAARRLVTTYGMGLVGQGLAVIARRQNIANPTGFLITWLRSESRRQDFNV